ncbi:unnamed protein product [Gongylonema pulchrum]|uniref:ZP domain-containing protein n=1 Tax=Gongylonema pulchrum TaxID=637853 RepID=A0A3P7LUE5_9BILA|nr:unnamed protein product [Gongylonema pulchrum]
MAAHSRGYIASPKYTMEVMDLDRNPTEVVHAGDDGYLLITPHENLGRFWTISLTAYDINSGRTRPIVDSEGYEDFHFIELLCAVPNGSLKEISRTEQNRLQLKITFDGFSDEADIIYHAYIKQCDDFCDMKCNGSLDLARNQQSNKNMMGRKKRSLAPSESRLFELSEDVYAVESTIKLTMKQRTHKIKAENYSKNMIGRKKRSLAPSESRLFELSEDVYAVESTIKLTMKQRTHKIKAEDSEFRMMQMNGHNDNNRMVTHVS